MVEGVLCGVWDIGAHDTIIGIMAKTGCIGKQCMIKPGGLKVISKFPERLCTKKSLAENLTKEAALLASTLAVGSSCVRRLAATLEIEVPAAEVLALMMERPQHRQGGS